MSSTLGFRYTTRMIDVKLRLFIPPRAVAIPLPIVGDVGFDGDNRGFHYENGTARAELWIDADNSPTATNPVTIKRREFGQSGMYGKDKLESVLGKPFWWKSVRRHPFLQTEELPDRLLTAERSERTLRVSGRLEPSVIPVISNLRLSFHVDGTNPLEPLAPPINCDLDVVISATGTKAFAYSLNGSHDGFPAYELYIEQRLVYSHDPERTGHTPLDLIQVGAVPVNVAPTVFI